MSLKKFSFFFLLFFAFPVVSSAAPRSFESLKEQVSDLRANDASVRKPEKWRSAAALLRSYSDETSNMKESALSLFLTAYLYDTVATETSSSKDGRRAIDTYLELSERFPNHDLSDDALLSVGDLRRQFGRDEAGARQAYYEVIDLYPRGNAAKEARLRVDQAVSRARLKAPAEEIASPKKETKKPERAKLKPAESRSIYSRPVPQQKRVPLVVIDPGHGGEDKGAVGVGGILEKDIVLEISKQLAALIEERLRARAILTRTDDRSIPLQDRIALANRERADLFLSVHANASEGKNANGIETYYLDNTEERSSLKLAERENNSLNFQRDGEEFDLSFMMSDLIQNAKVEDSISLSHHVQRSLSGTLSRYYSDVSDHGVRKAPFYVLVGAHMPCALVEVSFIDHPVEGRRLGNKRYQQLTALGLYEGIVSYFSRTEGGKGIAKGRGSRRSS